MAAKEKGSSRFGVLSDEDFYYGEDLLLLVPTRLTMHSAE
jgi:hypothetical protein